MAAEDGASTTASELRAGGPRAPRAARGPASAADVVASNRIGSTLGGKDDPSMLLLRLQFGDHARVRRRSVTLVQLPDDDRAEMEDCWKALDGDRNGWIDVKTLLKVADVVLGAGNYSDRNVRRAFGAMDVAHSGQVDWITYRAFMTANWYAGKNADDAMWNDNRKGDDMFLVDGSMRVIDLIKAYRRRTLVERALKDAQGQLRVMQQRRDAGAEEPGHEEGSPFSSASASNSGSTALGGRHDTGHRQRRRSISYEPGDDAINTSITARRGQGPSHSVPTRLKRAQEAIAAGGDHSGPLGDREWPSASEVMELSPADDRHDFAATTVATSGGSRILPPISVTPASSLPSPLTSPVDAPMASPPSRLMSRGSLPSSPLNSPAPGGGQPAHKSRYAGLDSGGDTDGSRHAHSEHSNTGKRGAHNGKPQLKKTPSAHAPALLSPIKQDVSSGFGRLAKFFWKSSSEPSLDEASYRQRLPKI